MTVYNLELFADYFQFYVQDDDRTVGDLSNAWTREAVDHLIAVGPGVVGVGTVRNMNVPVTVEIHDREPPGDLDLWEHVTECGLEVRTGRLVVAGCTDYFPDARRIHANTAPRLICEADARGTRPSGRPLSRIRTGSDEESAS